MVEMLTKKKAPKSPLNHSTTQEYLEAEVESTKKITTSQLKDDLGAKKLTQSGSKITSVSMLIRRTGS